MNKKRLIVHGVSFLLPVILLAILIPMFFGLQLDNNAMLLILLDGLVIYAMIRIFNKVGNTSHVPIHIGIILIVLSVTAYIGSTDILIPKMIALTESNQLYSLVGIGLGIVILVLGIKFRAKPKR